MTELDLTLSTDDESDLSTPSSLLTLTRPRSSQANPTSTPPPRHSTCRSSSRPRGSQAGPSRRHGASEGLSGGDSGGGELASGTGASSQGQPKRTSGEGVRGNGNGTGKGKGKAKEVAVIELSDSDDDDASASTSRANLSSRSPPRPSAATLNLDSDSESYDDLASPVPRPATSPLTTSQTLLARARMLNTQTEHASQAGSLVNRLPLKNSHERNRPVAASSSPTKPSILTSDSQSTPRAAATPAAIPSSRSPAKPSIAPTSISAATPRHSRAPGPVAESTPRARIGMKSTVISDSDNDSDPAMVESQLLPTIADEVDRRTISSTFSTTPYVLPLARGVPLPFRLRLFAKAQLRPLTLQLSLPISARRSLSALPPSPSRVPRPKPALPTPSSWPRPQLASTRTPAAAALKSAPPPNPTNTQEKGEKEQERDVDDSDDDIEVLSYNGVPEPPSREAQLQRTSPDEQDATRRATERKDEDAEKKGRAKEEEEDQVELHSRDSAPAEEDEERQLVAPALEGDEEDMQDEAMPELGFPRDDGGDQPSPRDYSSAASSIKILDNALPSTSVTGAARRPVEDVGADAEGDVPMAGLLAEDEVGGSGLAGEKEEEGELNVNQSQEDEGCKQLYSSPSKLKLQGRRRQVVPDSSDEDEQLEDDASTALLHPQPLAPLSAAKLSPPLTERRSDSTARKSTQGSANRPRSVASASLSLASSVRLSTGSLAQSPALQSCASPGSSRGESPVQQSSLQSPAPQSAGSNSPAPRPRPRPRRRATGRKSTQGSAAPSRLGSSVPSGPSSVLPSPEPHSVGQLGLGPGRKRAVEEEEQKGENEDRRKRLRSNRTSDEQSGASTSGSSTPKQSAAEEEGRGIAAHSKLKRKSLGTSVDKPARKAQALEQEAQTQAAPAQVQAEPPLVLNANATVADEPDEATKEQQRIKEAEFKLDQQLTPPCYRHIAGPSYDLHQEIDLTTQDHVALRERRWKQHHPPTSQPERKGYRILYEQMVFEANAREFPSDRVPSIRIIREKPDEPTPPPTEWWSPPFELGYTNRVIYADGIVPDQAPGCACVGNCGDPANRGSCACRARQIAASRTRPGGGERSGHQDFAYDENGVVNEKVLEAQDPIIECNSECGCGPECINRVVGKRKCISVDIYWTGNKGWAVRNPKSYDANDETNWSYTQRTIKKGEPLGVYAGELLPSPIADGRDDLVYHRIGRCYTYALDSWTIGEDYKRLAPLADADKIDVASHTAAHKSGPTTKRKTKKKGWSESGEGKGKGKDKAVDEEEDDDEEQDETVYTSLYSIDAFSYGNWTRFANHLCDGFNVVPRPVYVDEANVTRPLWVYVARKDIKPGEEITISYFSEIDPDPAEFGYSVNEWKHEAKIAREQAPKGHRCYCGARLCRGRMFNVPGKMFWEEREREMRATYERLSG
ncbi:hypothetical protein JCM5296_003927 [Sporobolomyces johnsonii]